MAADADNTFPGAACDIPSDLYSFSFAPNPRWTRVFPPQAEILAYLRALRGTAVAGFPNLFLLLGPNTTLAHNSMIGMIEAQLGYVLQAVRADAVLEARPEAVAAYDATIQDAMTGVVWTTGGCSSYYVDAGGRNTAAWPHGAARFARELRRFDEREYVAT